MKNVKWIGEKVAVWSCDGEGSTGKAEETVLRMDSIGLTTKDKRGVNFYPWQFVVLMEKKEAPE